MDDLKMCPFCGSDNTDIGGSYKGGLYVYCENCSAHGPVGFSVEYAEKLWNKRSLCNINNN